MLEEEKQHGFKDKIYQIVAGLKPNKKMLFSLQ